MKRLASKALIAAVVAASALVAAPAHARTPVPCPIPPFTPEGVLSCACYLVGDALSPVIPPSTWNCNF